MATTTATGDELPVTNPQVVVCIQPLGKHDARLLAAAERGVTYVYGFAVRRLPHAPMPKSAWYQQRRRYRADKLLDHLRDTMPEDCSLVVGFTSLDISTTKGKYKDWGVLGLGYIGGPSAVVSTFRTGKWRKRKTRRTVKVFNHEIGHVLGLPHLSGPGCLMNDAEGKVKTIDNETGLLCESAISYVEKEHGVSIPKHGSFQWSEVE